MKTSADGEMAFVARLKAGDEAAFRELVQRYNDRLYKVAYGITLDAEEARDIVQDVFIKAHQHIGRFKGQAKLSTWLHRITVNHCLNWKRKWRRRMRWHTQPLEKENGTDYKEIGTENYGPDTLYRERELQRRFNEHLRSLPEDARTVFVLKEAEGLSYDEIAKILKIKRGTVSSRLFYARKKLKDALKPYLEDEPD